MAKRFWIIFLSILAGITIATACAYAYWAMAEYHFVTVTDGRVYRSGAMPPEKLWQVVRENGIRTVIDLRRYDEEVEKEREALAMVGVRHISLHSGQVPTASVVARFLNIMARKNTYPVLIHCKHGIGRAVLFSAIYRMEFEGWTPEEARRAAYWRSAMGDFSPKDDKGRYILNYPWVQNARGPGKQLSHENERSTTTRTSLVSHRQPKHRLPPAVFFAWILHQGK